MLHEIVAPSALLPDIGNELAHNVQLMKTGEYNPPLLSLVIDELLDDIEKRILRKHIPPEIIRRSARSDADIT